jgi:hypothetical protein
MLHSSELMPGGSPTFRDKSAIERLYGDLRALFALAATECRPATLAEFHAWITNGRVNEPPVAPLQPQRSPSDRALPA